MGCNLLPVVTDHNGMIPEALEEIMSRWKPEDAKLPQCRIPKILYTIPNGVNPTGASLTLDRKQTIYKVISFSCVSLVPLFLHPSIRPSIRPSIH